MSNSNHNVVELQNVSKIYQTYSTPQHRLLELLSGGRKQYARETRALDDISFALERGGRLGIVGENGSGKSTLLKVLAGVLSPSKGTAQVRGRVSALLELGAGFNPDLPGIENIRQFGMLHGMSRDEIDAAVPEVIRFSELRDAVNHPVKTYSSGMAVRLGFACAVYVQPDILIVDEALSVGDAYFQNKCLHKIKSLLDNGTTFIYVTHAADSIRALCSQGLWLERGKVRKQGSSADVGAAYQSDVFKRIVRAGLPEPEVPVDAAVATVDGTELLGTGTGVQDAPLAGTPGAGTPAAGTPATDTPAPGSAAVQVNDAPPVATDAARHQAFEERVAALRTGSGEARIVDIALIGADGRETDSLPLDAACTVRVFYRCNAVLPESCALTLGVTDNVGRQLLHFNSTPSRVFLPSDGAHMLRVVEFKFTNPLSPGEYGFIAGIGTFVANPRNHGQYLTDRIVDYVAGGARFSVRFPDEPSDWDLWGVVHTPFQVAEYSLD
jgi:lipopolysaccharide transport system ATP-binding protein